MLTLYVLRRNEEYPKASLIYLHPFRIRAADRPHRAISTSFAITRKPHPNGKDGMVYRLCNRYRNTWISLSNLRS